jgi:hypothetical protein
MLWAILGCQRVECGLGTELRGHRCLADAEPVEAPLVPGHFEAPLVELKQVTGPEGAVGRAGAGHDRMHLTEVRFRDAVDQQPAELFYCGYQFGAVDVSRPGDPVYLAQGFVHLGSALEARRDEAVAGVRASAAALEAEGARAVAAIYRVFEAALAPADEVGALLDEVDRLRPEAPTLRMARGVRRARQVGLDARARADLDEPGWYNRLIARLLLPGALVDRRGAWFEAGGERVALDRRAVLRRILAALAEAGPGGLVGRSAMVEAGWPGERLVAASADTRLKVAISTLRKLGLGEHLRTGERDREVAYGLAATARIAG